MLRLACLAAVLAALALPVHSQDEDAIVVTATRFPERLFEAPIGVRIISATDIAASAATTLPELLSEAGGVHVRDNSGSPDKQLDLRGFGITSDQNTLVLVDGVRINQNDLGATRLSTIPLQSIERIEILPGGGAVPYGAGATGGTIHIITRGPEAGKRSAVASVSAGKSNNDIALTTKRNCFKSRSRGVRIFKYPIHDITGRNREWQRNLIVVRRFWIHLKGRADKAISRVAGSIGHVAGNQRKVCQFITGSWHVCAPSSTFRRSHSCDRCAP